MKQLLMAMLVGGSVLGASAGHQEVIHGTTYNVDTLESYYIGPAVEYTHYKFTTPDGKRFFQAYTVILDKTDERHTAFDGTRPAEMKVALGNDSCCITESVPNMAAFHTNENTQYIAGCNGDFFVWRYGENAGKNDDFLDGYPGSGNIIGGRCATPNLWNHGVFMTGPDGSWVDWPSRSHVIASEDGSQSTNATECNYPRDWAADMQPLQPSDRMIIYNRNIGDYTNTLPGGREIRLMLAEGEEWRTNKPMKFVVDSDWYTGGNMAVPEEGIVISCGQYYNNDFIYSLKKGDVIYYTFNVTLPHHGNIQPDIREAIGGNARIVDRGKRVDFGNDNSTYMRALIGYSEDNTKIIMATVDGERVSSYQYSSGLSMNEIGDFMINRGCYEALNMDGGGSVTLYEQAHGVVNKPADLYARRVSNGLFVAVNAPASPEVESVRFLDTHANLPLYASYTPVIYGYNKYGRLVDINFRDAVLEADEEFCRIDNGTITVVKAGSFALSAVLGDKKVSIPVTVEAGSQPELKYKKVLIGNQKSCTVGVQSLVNNEYKPLASNIFDWSSSDNAVVEVDETGALKAVADGTATVTGRLNEYELPVTVTVEEPTQRYMPVFAAEKNWSVSGKGSKGRKMTRLDNGGYRLYFEVTAANSNVKATRSEQIWSLPDAIEFNVLPEGDMEGLYIEFNVQAANATSSRAFRFENLVDGEVNKLVLDPASQFDVNDIGIYPLTFKSLLVTPANAVKSGIYAFDIVSVNGVYNSAPIDGIADITIGDGYESRLTVKVVNGMIVAGEETSALAVYDLNGRLIAEGAGNTVAAPATPGVYVVRAVAGSAVKTAKLIVR